MIDGTQILKGTSLPGKDLQVYREAEGGISLSLKKLGRRKRYRQMQLGLKGPRKGVVWLGFLCRIKGEFTCGDEELEKRGNSLEWWLEWERKLLGTCKRFSSSKKSLSICHSIYMGQQRRMIKVLFIMGKERKLQVDRDTWGDYSTASVLEVAIGYALGVRE